MRLSVLLAPLLFAATTSAQCVQTDLGFDPVQRNTGTGDVAFLTNGLVAVGVPIHPNGNRSSRGVNVSRSDPGGAMIWFKHLLPTNPDIRMASAQVVATPDGGLMVAGDLDHGVPMVRYHNQYMVKLDVNGLVQWARIYMLLDTTNSPGVGWGNDQYGHRLVDIVALQTGGYACQFMNEHQVHHVTLDPNGIPLSCRMYIDHGLIHQHGESALHPDGSWFHGYFGDSSVFSIGRFGYFHVDANGTVQYARHVAEPSPWGGYMHDALPLANGDHLLSGRSATGELMRIDASGQLLWRREFGESPEAAVELPDGTLLGRHGWYLLQFTADGYSMNSWWTNNNSPWNALAAEGDSLIAVRQPAGQPRSVAHVSSSFADLTAGCGLSPFGSIVVNTLPAATNTITIDTDTSSIKTWTLSLSGLNDTLDLVAFAELGAVRPGFATTLLGSAINLSGSASAGITVTCELPSLLSVTSIQPAPTSIIGNTLSWTLPDGLQAMSYWSFQIGATLPPDPLLIGTQLGAVVTVVHDSAEVDLSNNSSTVIRTITGSYDPNDKLVRTSSGLSDTEYYPAEDSWIDYTIRFQNTGNDTAFTVVLTDTLPDLFSVASFTVLGASHPYTYQLSAQGVLRVTFSNILLPDSGTNMAASQGLFAFRIAPDQVPVVGTTITNVADIFFDLNPPIRTPDATVVVTAPTAVAALAPAQPISVFPNPARDRIEVLLPADLEVTGWSIAAADGRLLRHQGLALTRGRLSVPLHGLAPGLHVLQLYSVEGRVRTVRFAVE